MRVGISIDDGINVLTTAVDDFFTYHLADKFYGIEFDQIHIEYLSNPKKGKLKRRKLYGSIAQIQIESSFDFSADVTVQSFANLCREFADAAEYIRDIPHADFDVIRLCADIKQILNKLPQNEPDLEPWRNTREIQRATKQKLFEHRNTNQDFDKRQQEKQVPLRHVDLVLEDENNIHSYRKTMFPSREKPNKAIPIAWVQGVFFQRYMSQEIQKLKFKGQFKDISIVLGDDYEIQKYPEGVAIIVPFDFDEYRKVYPPFEVDVPLNDLIPNVNETAVNDYIYQIFMTALRYAKEEKLLLPVDDIIDILNVFKANQYRFEWCHKSRRFKDLGITARLECQLRNYCFSLDVVLLHGKKEVLRKEIHKSQPWQEAWRHYYEDIVLEDDHLIVTRQYAGESIYKISVADVLKMITHH